MNPIKVEIGQYKIIDKGSLKASFSLVIYPEGQKILECKYFVQGDKRWFNFPQKEVKKPDGQKSDYIPLVSYMNKDYYEQLKTAVLEAIKDAKPLENYGQKNNTTQRQANPLPTEPSDAWGDAPF